MLEARYPGNLDSVALVDYQNNQSFPSLSLSSLLWRNFHLWRASRPQTAKFTITSRFSPTYLFPKSSRRSQWSDCPSSPSCRSSLLVLSMLWSTKRLNISWGNLWESQLSLSLIAELAKFPLSCFLWKDQTLILCVSEDCKNWLAFPEEPCFCRSNR